MEELRQRLRRRKGSDRKNKTDIQIRQGLEYFNEENSVRRSLTCIKGWQAGLGRMGRMASKLYRVVACLKD